MFIKSIKSVKEINAHLKPYEKYVNKYICNYNVSPKEGIESLTFYHKTTNKPYVIVCIGEDEYYPSIYENLKQDDFYEDHLIKNMTQFIMAIRQCMENE